MQNKDDLYGGTMTNNPVTMNPSLNMQDISPCPCYPPQGAPMMANPMVYPEVFYKLQPYIMLVCDQMDTFGPMMPTQEMVEQMTDGIYDDVCRMYPEMAEYARENEMKAKDDPPDPPESIGVISRGFDRDFGRGFGRGFGRFDRGFRRRGLFRDLIDIMFLSELSRRRRRFF